MPCKKHENQKKNQDNVKLQKQAQAKLQIRLKHLAFENLTGQTILTKRPQMQKETFSQNSLL